MLKSALESAPVVSELDTTFRKSVVVSNRLGLHARPAAMLIQKLQPFRSKVFVECGGERVNAKSILGLLSLAARKGSELTFTATGPDCMEALAAVEGLFRSELTKID